MRAGHVVGTLLGLGALLIEAAVDVHVIPLLAVEQAVSAAVTVQSDTGCKK